MTKIRRCPELDALAATCVNERAAPCAVVACAYRNSEGWRVDEGACGHLAPGEVDADPSTLFDLASVTKPVSALTFARLVRSELLDWHMPIGVPLRDVHGTPSAYVPLAWFAAHRSGLDGHRPLYAPLERGLPVDRFKALRQAGEARRPECHGEPESEGFPALYSDLGYLLLGEAMARAAGVSLDELLRREVLKPLALTAGSARQWRRVDPAFDARVAPTEDVAWRGGVIRGAVHDENAWAIARDAACAHAGLFGTARDVATLGTAILDASRGDRTDWLTPEEVEPLLRKRPDSTWRAGFDGKSNNGSSAGKLCSPETFGHLGFTGTSIWIDPTVDVVVVLLTNRVHPTRDSAIIKAVRPIVHDALFAWGMERSSHR
jgi:serine-type D-Ala-D-Ala carboxypeptidase